jgi:hypothetical protein
MRSRLVTAAALALVFASHLPAHHSLSGVYDTSKEIKLNAVVREFHFVNPHPFIAVEVTRSGKVEVWKLEMDNRFELINIGVVDTTFKPGDRITVSGSPGRSEPALYIRRLDRPADGFWYEQVGFEPRIRGQRK